MRTVPSSPATDLVAVTGVSNVTGEVWPLARLAEIAHRHGAQLFVDGAQLAPHRPIDVAAAGIDFVALSGHKLYAPFGAGALVGPVSRLSDAAPLLHGGGAIRLVTLVAGPAGFAPECAARARRRWCMNLHATQPTARPHVGGAARRSAIAQRREVPAPIAQRRLRVLFLVSAHNSLSQRVQIALTELGHEVAVAVVDSGGAMEAAVARHRSELIVCPMLKTIIPESIFDRHRCLIVHPGPKGDRGPSSLDWAIELGVDEWGVTVLEATGEVDGGDVWATRTFRTREAGKSSLYRHEVRRAAIDAVVQAVTHVAEGDVAPEALDYGDPRVTGRPRPLITQADRAIEWESDSTASVLRRVRAAEGHPGVLDTVEGTPFHLFGGHREQALHGRPGELVAQRHGAICRATVDGAVWITLEGAKTLIGRDRGLCARSERIARWSCRSSTSRSCRC